MSQPLTSEMIDAITKASSEGMENALQKFGFDVENPLEVQKDQAFITKQRKASEKVTLAVKTALIISLVSGAISILIIGFKQVIH